MNPKWRLISHFSWRAPLLPLSALARPGSALRKHPLGSQAIALASPALSRALGKKSAAAQRSLARYGRRAAFRPTPHGLLAGVGMGMLGARTTVATAEASAHFTWSWTELAAAGRALLDEPAARAGARLRVAPSLVVEGGEAAWLFLPVDRDTALARDAAPVPNAALAESGGPASDAPLEVRRWEVDEALAAVLDALADWTPWPVVRVAAHSALAPDADESSLDDEAVDEYLFLLLEQGIVHHDLSPPLVGLPPLAWMRQRLAALPVNSVAVQALQTALQAPPRAPHATLLLGGRVIVQRSVAERAADLAPVLFRLQEALASPVAERALDRALLDRLDGLAEIYGAGGFSCAGLAAGSFGDTLVALDDAPAPPTPPDAVLLGILAEALTEAARAGRDAIDLDSTALMSVLAPVACPPSFELILTPGSSPRGSAPGTDWMLGLHSPAGATWGRFAHALGEPMTDALAELAAAEGGSVASTAGVECLDIAFAASAKLADLCVHPRVRSRALALVSWPEGPALCPRALALVVDPSARPSLSLRDADGGTVRPSPLHRVRSTTAPAGIFRLLAGWSFARQHAPWAFGWGALGDLSRLPRVRVDGFVVAPASWRIPPAEALGKKAFARWRRDAHVPACVQVGEGDELLFVDLDAPDAAADLARHAGGRAFEIWPPLEAVVDAGGRRVEAVIGVVLEPTPDAGAPLGAVSPRVAPGWTTYKLFGREESQDEVLLHAIRPLMNEALARGGGIDDWFFQRYIDGPGRRDHLRLRVHADSARAAELFGRRLRAAIAPLHAAEHIVAVETAEYFPEIARYGGAETFASVERLFACDSQLVLDLLAAESDQPPASDRVDWLVRSFDALASGLGLDPAARRTLAARRREGPVANDLKRVLDAEYRQRQRSLAGLMGGSKEDFASAAFATHRARVEAVVASLPLERRAKLFQALPPLLHVCAVRLAGARPADEAAAYVFWERTLEGLAARHRR